MYGPAYCAYVCAALEQWARMKADYPRQTPTAKNTERICRKARAREFRRVLEGESVQSWSQRLTISYTRDDRSEGPYRSDSKQAKKSKPRQIRSVSAPNPSPVAKYPDRRRVSHDLQVSLQMLVCAATCCGTYSPGKSTCWIGVAAHVDDLSNRGVEGGGVIQTMQRHRLFEGKTQ